MSRATRRGYKDMLVGWEKIQTANEYELAKGGSTADDEKTGEGCISVQLRIARQMNIRKGISS